MPRSLARLRWKTPRQPKPLNVARLDPNRPDLLEQKISRHVVRQSKPQPLRVQSVVNPKAKPLSAGQGTPRRPHKPHTLRDLVDIEHARHGQIIYVFRNKNTNQIIYSLAELLDNHHLDQLPFISRHSKPPALRPDEWVPHCVVTFPTPEQGHNAFRKLREFRKLHELSWKKHNPEWLKLTKKDRMEKIMDQRANMSADLAEVLSTQNVHGQSMAKALEEQQRKAREYLETRWPEINALAQAAEVKAREGDNVKWLEHQIRSLTFKLKMKHNQNDADQKRLEAAKKSHEVRLKRIEYAQRKAVQYKKTQLELEEKAAPANQSGAEAKLQSLREEILGLREAIANLDGSRSSKVIQTSRELIKTRRSELKPLEDAFEAKRQLEERDHYIFRSILPHQFRNTLPQPYTLEGVTLKWADLIDVEYAADRWPLAIEHDVLPLNSAREEVHYMGIEQYEEQLGGEIRNMVAAAQGRSIEVEESTLDLDSAAEPKEKTGIFKYLPEVKNPFKRAEA